MNKNKSVSEAQKRAYQKYIAGTDEIRIRAPKGTKQTIMEYLLRSGETMQEFVLRATCEMIEDDQIREEQYKRLCGYNEVYLNIRKKEIHIINTDAFFQTVKFGKTVSGRIDIGDSCKDFAPFSFDLHRFPIVCAKHHAILLPVMSLPDGICL